jgi:hypothetical protein
MSLDCPLKRFARSQDATGLDRLADPFTNFGDFRRDIEDQRCRAD